MEKVNFLVNSNYALDVDGRHIDLHNNFDFESVEYSIRQNKLSVTWVKVTGDWSSGDEFGDELGDELGGQYIYLYSHKSI